MINKIYQYFGWHRWIYMGYNIFTKAYPDFRTHKVYHCSICNILCFQGVSGNHFYDPKKSISCNLEQPEVKSCMEMVIYKVHES